MKKYIVVHEGNTLILERKINELYEQGYEVKGEISVRYDEYMPSYIVLMIKRRINKCRKQI